MEAQLSDYYHMLAVACFNFRKTSFGDCIRKGSVSSDTPSIAQDLQELSSQNFLN